jgi:phosphogluconate dehydratase
VIHLSPEALLQGPIGKVRTGDMLVIDAEAGVLDIEIDAAEWEARPLAECHHKAENEVGFGRELFGVFRSAAAPAELGASVFGPLVGESAHHDGAGANGHGHHGAKAGASADHEAKKHAAANAAHAQPSHAMHK